MLSRYWHPGGSDFPETTDSPWQDRKYLIDISFLFRNGFKVWFLPFGVSILKFKDWKVSKWLLMMNCVNSQHIYLIFTTWLSCFLRQRSISGFDIWDKDEMLTLGPWVLPTTGRASFFGVFIASESLLCCIILHCDVVYHCLGYLCGVVFVSHYCTVLYFTLYCIVLPGSLYWSSSEKLAWHGNLVLESALTSYFTNWTGSLFCQHRNSIFIDFMTFLVSMEPSP